MRATLKVMRDRTGASVTSSRLALCVHASQCRWPPLPVYWWHVEFYWGSRRKFRAIWNCSSRFGNQRLNQPQFVQCPRRYSGVCVAMPWCGRRMPCIRYRRGCWMRRSRRWLRQGSWRCSILRLEYRRGHLFNATLLSNSSARASDDHFRLAWVRARPFSMNHWCTARKQLSSDVTALSRSSMYNWVSSAYWVWWTPNEEITPAIGATYVEKSAGPSTEPWGTPNRQCTDPDRSSPIRTNCVRSSRYVFIQRSADPVIPNVCSKRRRSVSMSMVSNAAERHLCWIAHAYIFHNIRLSLNVLVCNNVIFLLVDIDDCFNIGCANGGTCVDGVNSYTCSCFPRFTGISCQSSSYRIQRIVFECRITPRI